MDIEILKTMLKETTETYARRTSDIDVAERYYRNETDILLGKEKKDDEDNPLHNADNRIPGGFHRLLVKQKASYLLTYPPMFDVGADKGNKKVASVLGGRFPKRCKQLCVNAANAGDAWVHYWDEDGVFKYGIIKSQQLRPIWSDDMEDELIGMVRAYKQLDTDNGRWYIVYEVWNDTECQAFRRLESTTIDTIVHYNMFFDVSGEPTNTYTHDFGKVPFIQFRNNDECMSDLTKTMKGLIDSYDKTYCGFVNDLEDIQEIIFVLSGYEGEDKNGLLQDIKKYKTILLDGDKDSNSGVQTLNIEIPVEARQKLLEITRRAIFEQGQGMDPLQESFGTKSGEALKFMYCLLELKAGDTETEFRSGFDELIRVICEHEGIKCDDVIQTWTRNAIRNEKEQAEICNTSNGVVSKRTILANHPYVDNVEDELEQLDEEAKDIEADADMFDDVEDDVDGEEE